MPSCSGHSLAFATLRFLQPPLLFSWGLRAGSHIPTQTHTAGASQDSGVLTGITRQGKKWKKTKISSPNRKPLPLALASKAGWEAGVESLEGCPQGVLELWRETWWHSIPPLQKLDSLRFVESLTGVLGEPCCRGTDRGGGTLSFRPLDFQKRREMPVKGGSSPPFGLCNGVQAEGRRVGGEFLCAFLP
jgi:hypothetical protein